MPPLSSDKRISCKYGSCTCPREIKSLGRLDGFDMGKGYVRLSTTKNCPVHDSCHKFTKEFRAKQPSWSTPWCPIHETKDCP